MAYRVFRDCSLLSCAGVVPDNRLSLIYLFTASLYYMHCVHHLHYLSHCHPSGQNAADCTARLEPPAEQGAVQIHKAAEQADLGWQRA